MKVEKVQYVESGKTEEENSPCGDKMGMPERTPPQSRLLSHENPSAMKSDKYQELQEGQVVSSSNADFRNSKSPVGSGDSIEVMFAGQATEIQAVKPPKSPEPHLISISYRQTALHYEVSKNHQTPSRAKSAPSSTQKQPPSLAGYATKIPTIKSPKYLRSNVSVEMMFTMLWALRPLEIVRHPSQ
ncbi:hypothetical protein Ancab_010297 [Ancistrocladus abbreviatus]